MLDGVEQLWEVTFQAVKEASDVRRLSDVLLAQGDQTAESVANGLLGLGVKEMDDRLV